MTFISRKKALIFDKRIFRIYHNVIDNYNKLERKEDLFCSKKTHLSQQKNIKKKKK